MSKQIREIQGVFDSRELVGAVCPGGEEGHITLFRITNVEKEQVNFEYIL